MNQVICDERLVGEYPVGDRIHKLIACSLPDRSVLLVERNGTPERRLVGRFEPGEPYESVVLLASDYADAEDKRCREVAVSDYKAAPRDTPSATPIVTGPHGETISLGVVQSREYHGYEVRWCRQPAIGPLQPITLRDAIALCEDYEPFTETTRWACETLRPSPGVRRVGIATLSGELQRVEGSPIVLNRKLREAVLGLISEGVTASEIATRCKRIKRDRYGNVSGETSWLMRRIGASPESGRNGRFACCVWVHSHVLGRIARACNLDPREVEL